MCQGTAPMSVGGNRNALNCSIGPSGKRDWSYGLFDCFSACGLCTWNCINASHVSPYTDPLDLDPFPPVGRLLCRLVPLHRLQQE
jgi:hypothetical protein